MTKFILFLAGPFIISCHLGAQKVLPTVTGKYILVGFKVKSDMDRNGGRLMAAADQANYAFNFLNNDSLLMAPQLSKLFFADSVFQYRLTAATLFLTSKDGEHIIPYRRDVISLNLFIDQSGIDTLTIVPAKRDTLP